MTKNPEVTQPFSKEEIGLIWNIMNFSDFKRTPRLSADKSKELTALETFREIGKGINQETKNFVDCELSL
jgi:hypothetical protein